MPTTSLQTRIPRTLFKAFRWFVLGCCLLSLTSFASAQQAPKFYANNLFGEARLPEPVVWGQDVFVIPYQWSGQTDPSKAQAVVLYLSQDAGANWRQVTTAKPEVRSFMYRSTGDGEYWFAVRTIDKAGVAWPQGDLAPELRVIVDTQIPQIVSLQATVDGNVDGANQLNIECSVSDTNLDDSSLRIKVADTSGNWQNVPVTLVPGTNDQQLTAKATLPMLADQQQASIRVTIADQAGNPASAGTTVGTNGGASTAMTAAPAYGFNMGPTQPPAGFNPGPVAGLANDSLSGPLADPFLGGNSMFAELTPAAPPSQPLAPRTTPATNANWGGGPALQPMPQQSVPQQHAQQPVARQPASDVWQPDASSPAPFRGRSMSNESFRPLPSVTPYEQPQSPDANAHGSPFHQASSSRFSNRNAAPQLLSPSGAASSAMSDRPAAAQSVSSTRFELDYNVAAAGRWGVSRVVLWGTRDRGETWRQFAIDGDNRSPLQVTVPAEGLYGFRILVESVGGLDPEPPRPGDQPELWIDVDQTEPAVRLTNIHQGEGYFGDHLIINWTATDRSLNERPITLLYATRPEGPWLPIASNLENSSRYAWRLQRHLPSQLYVRLEATDTAGNTATAITPQPLAIQLAEPTATVNGVRAIGG